MSEGLRLASVKGLSSQQTTPKERAFICDPIGHLSEYQPQFIFTSCENMTKHKGNTNLIYGFLIALR